MTKKAHWMVGWAAALLGVSMDAAPHDAWVFVQAGAAEDANSLVVGAGRGFDWHRDFAGGELTAYWELSAGRWRSEVSGRNRADAWVTQFGVTPVLRWSPPGGRWFVEGAVGANMLLPVFQTDERRFSTKFNFGDHLAAGWRFGDRAQHEIALRVEHFSNAGIRRPNPGDNFVQLRYSHHR